MINTLWSYDYFRQQKGCWIESIATPILAMADSAVEQRFSPLHAPPVQFEGQIDWNADFNGGSWPDWPIGKLGAAIFENDFTNDFYNVDIKLNWEFNKHEWFPALALAYRITENGDYIGCLENQVRDFMGRTDPRNGPAWCATLIVAQRLINWSIAAALLADRKPSGKRPLFADNARIHVDYILDHLETSGLPTNHIISNWSAIAIAALTFVEWKDSDILAGNALCELTQQMALQIYPDGIHWEQSLPYHRYVLEFFLLPALAATGRNRELPEGYLIPIEKMMGVLLETMNPRTGRIPMIGDGDGAKVWRFSTAHTLDARSLLGLGAVLFNRADFKWACANQLSDIVCLLGESGVTAYEQLPSTPPTHKDREFPDGGYTILRADWSKTRTELFFDCGRISMGDAPKDHPHGTHGHADTLHFNLTADGRLIFGDPGCYSYTGKPRKWHDYFRGGAGHNTVLVDGHAMSTLTTTWAMQERPMPGKVVFVSSPKGTLAEGSQNGFHRLNDPVDWHRALILLPNGTVLIRDKIGSEKPHDLEFRFHLAPDIQAEQQESWIDLSLSDGKPVGSFFSRLPNSADTKLVKGQKEPPLGFWSDDYNQVCETTVIRVKVRTDCVSDCFWCFRPAIISTRDFDDNLENYFLNHYKKLITEGIK